MKLGEIYDFKNAEEAKQYIGKKGLFGDSLWEICERPAEERFGILVDADYNDIYPFVRYGRRAPFQFFRPVLEEEEIKGNLGKLSPKEGK